MRSLVRVRAVSVERWDPEYMCSTPIVSAVSAVLTPDVGPDAVQFLVSKTVPYPDTPVPESAQLRIGRQTQYSNLAGALAGRARDGAMRLSITGSGAGQVLLLVKALALASKFIASDGVVLTGYPDFGASWVMLCVPWLCLQHVY